ncbi:MAG TPA: hypothetical protein VLG50_04500 [Candidatus Saccharimonadales bacterium]|nr:hypothetical protein [Candidatus Saccharimonadales bacterium]
MKRLFIFLIMSCCFLQCEESIFKQKQIKQSASQLKEELAQGLQDVLHQCTQSMRTITELIDDIVVHAKELSGQQEGSFATSDKEQLKLHIKKVNEIQKMLLSIEELKL